MASEPAPKSIPCDTALLWEFVATATTPRYPRQALAEDAASFYSADMQPQVTAAATAWAASVVCTGANCEKSVVYIGPASDNGNPWVPAHDAKYTKWWVEVKVTCKALVRCRKKGTWDLPPVTTGTTSIKPKLKKLS